MASTNDGNNKSGRPKKISQEHMVLQKIDVDELDLPVRQIVGSDENMERLEIWTDDNIQGLINDQDEYVEKTGMYMDELDNLICEENVDGPWEDSANFHVPITLWMMKQMHARIYAALLGDGYGFVTLPQEKMDLAKVREVDQIMRWAITQYANNWRGIALTIDDWIFDCVKYGWGVLRVMWDCKYQKVSLTEEELRRFNKTAKIEDTLENMIQIIKTWEGPQIDTVAHENILFPGRAKDSMDMNEFPMVAEVIELTPEDVKRRILQKRWFKKPAEAVLKMYEGTTTNNTTTNRQLDDAKRLKDAAQGVKDYQSDASVNKKITFYQIKARVDVDNDSFEEDLVYIFEPVTKKVMTVTTLDRVNVMMSSFYHKVDFIRRPRRTRGIGMAELLYSINREIDAMHNQRIDFGTISSVPTFFFRPLSGMKAEKIQLKPGQGIPLANPRTDVFIPNFSSNITFTRQEENLLINYAERVAALPSITSGQSPSPAGPASTATGITSLLSQTGFDFDVILNRFKKTYEDVLKNIHAQMTVRMPEGIKFRLLGEGNGQILDENGVPMVEEVTRQKLYGSWDFRIKANDRALNREVDKQDALVLANILFNPILLQSGIVTPENIYNIAENILMKRGEVDVSRFITNIANTEQPLSVVNELVVITQGQMPRIVMNDDHEKKIESLSIYKDSQALARDVAGGLVDQGVYGLFDQAIKKHQRLLDSITAQANQANVTGQQVGTSLGARMSGEINQQSGRSIADEKILRAEQENSPTLTQGGLELPAFGNRP